MTSTLNLNGKKIQVFEGEDAAASLSENDKEMDKRAVAAVNAAIEKAKVCKKPIARYDRKTKTAKLVYEEA